jgi:hypothetical protein
MLKQNQKLHDTESLSYLQDEISCRDQCCTHDLLKLSKYNLQFYAA